MHNRLWSPFVSVIFLVGLFVPGSALTPLTSDVAGAGFDTPLSAVSPRPPFPPPLGRGG